LDYIADEKASRKRASYGWVFGNPDSRFINRMRHKRPTLYEAMRVRRNKWWATQITRLLATGGVYFVW